MGNFNAEAQRNTQRKKLCLKKDVSTSLDMTIRLFSRGGVSGGEAPAPTTHF
jgi:hypothetical protein